MDPFSALLVSFSMARRSLVSAVLFSFLFLGLCSSGVNGYSPYASHHGSYHHGAHLAFQKRNLTQMTLDDARKLVA